MLNLNNITQITGHYIIYMSRLLHDLVAEKHWSFYISNVFKFLCHWLVLVGGFEISCVKIFINLNFFPNPLSFNFLIMVLLCCFILSGEHSVGLEVALWNNAQEHATSGLNVLAESP